MLRNLISYLVFIGCFFLFSMIVWSQSSSWESIGPTGANYNSIIKSDPHSGTLYFYGNSTLFKSGDNGNNWNDITPQYLNDSYYHSLVIHEGNPDELYFINGGHGIIYKSTDAGLSWQIYFSDTKFEIKFLDKTNPEIIIALKPSGGWGNFLKTIEKSTDAGNTWSEITAGIDPTEGPLEAWVNPNFPDEIVAGQSITHGGDVVYGYKYFISSNNGDSWDKLDNAGTLAVDHVVFDPLNDSIFYFQDIYNRWFKTKDKGSSFLEIGVDLKGIKLGGIYIAGDNSDLIFAVAGDTVFNEYSDIHKSADGGLTWELFSTVPESQSISSILIKPGSHNEFFISSYPYGVYYSSDNGQNWNSKSNGLTQSEVCSFNAYNSQIIYAGVGSRGWVKTTNGGTDWIVIDKNLSSCPGEIQVSSNNPDYLFYNDDINGGNFSFSSDGGNTWQGYFCEYNGLNAFDVGPDNQTIWGDAYIGSNGDLIISGIIKSTNCGIDWSLVETGISGINYIDKIEIDPADKNIVYIIVAIRESESRNTLIKTTDGGTTWNVIAENCWDFYLNRKDPAYLYYLYDGRFFISNDRGTTFTDIVLDFDPKEIIADLRTSGRLFALAFNSGIKWSGDYGFTWHSINALKDDFRIEDIEICYNDQDMPVLFGSTWYKGILKYEFDNQTGIIDNPQVALDNYMLFQNYPNPFNPATAISYSLPSESFVTLKVYDVLGREVSSLLNNELKPAGNYSVQFDGYDLPSGIYFYRLQTDNFISTKKMMLIK